MSVFKKYRKAKTQLMRPYVEGENMTGISVSKEDKPEVGGMIAFDPENQAMWYVSKKFFDDNYELVDE